MSSRCLESAPEPLKFPKESFALPKNEPEVFLRLCVRQLKKGWAVDLFVRERFHRELQVDRGKEVRDLGHAPERRWAGR